MLSAETVTTEPKSAIDNLMVKTDNADDVRDDRHIYSSQKPRGRPAIQENDRGNDVVAATCGKV